MKVVTAIRKPALDANQIDTGADTVTYLDMNGDGTVGDYVTADHDTKLIRIHLAPVGGGTAYTNFDFTAGSNPVDLAVADVNNDNLPDIITCEGGNIVVYLNTTSGGTVSFDSGTTLSTNDVNGNPLTINKITVADVDNDGLPDIIGVGTATVSSNQNIQLAVFRNTHGTGSPFAAAAVYTSLGTGDYVQAGDLTRNALDADNNPALDSFPEIVVASNNSDTGANNSGEGSYTVFLNKGDGTFGSDGDATAAPLQGFVFLHFNGLALGDIDGDGNRDLVYEASNIGSTHNQVFATVSLGNADGTFGTANDGFTFVSNASSAARARFPGDVALADLNGDGTLDIVMTDPLTTNGVVIWTVDPNSTGSNIFNSSNRSTVATGTGARAIGITDFNDDSAPDLIVANQDANNLTLLANTTSGSGTTPPPPGRDIVFGTPVTNQTGDTITIPVLRGSGSTGQVVEYFGVGGTALQFASGSKQPDFTFVQPAGTQSEVTFPAPPDQQADAQNIVIHITPTKSTQVKSITLTLLTPVGDADVASPSLVSIPISAGKAALLKAPSGLVVTPTNFTKVSFHPSDIKIIGYTGSDWDFAVLEPAVAGAQNLGVSIETTGDPTDPVNFPWTHLLDLTSSGKGKWTGSTRDLPTNSTEIFFRARATATGLTDAVGPASQPIGIIPGPELSLNIIAETTRDTTGDTIHVTTTPPSETITYHVTIANVGNGAASNAIVNFPIPTHTSYSSASANNGTPHTVTKGGKIVSGGWTFTLIPGKTTYEEDLTVNLDLASAFSAKDPTKAFGYIVKATGFSVSATTEGIKAGANLVKEIDTEVVGPISMDVTADLTTANPGDVITYTIDASNESGSLIPTGQVEDHIPPGTVLETLYAPNSSTDANSSTNPLPNPGPYTAPRIVYVRNSLGPTIDLSSITDPVTLALAIGFMKAKPTQEFDFLTLKVQAIGKGANSAQFDDAITQLINAEVVVPTAVIWPLTSIPANGQITLKYRVRILYDLFKLSQTDPNGVPTNIANNNYDFTIPSGSNTISALYGATPTSTTTTLNLTPPTTEPAIALSKFSYGDHVLNNPNYNGHGSQLVAGFGEITTVVQSDGFDFGLFYSNSGTSDAHDVVIHEVIPAGAVLRGFFTQSINGGAPFAMTSEQFSYYDASGNLIPNSAVGTFDKVRSMDVRLSAFNNLTPLQAGEYGEIRYTIQATAVPAAPGKPPTYIHSLGGFDPNLKRSDPQQGAYITSSDLSITVPASPDDRVVKVIADVAFDLRYTKGVYTAKPLDYVPFDFVMNQNGDAIAANAVVNVVIPQGTVLATGPTYGPQFTDGTSGGPTITLGSNSSVGLNFGNIAGHVNHTFRIYLQVNSVNGALDPVLKAKHRLYFDTDPTVTYTTIITQSQVRLAQFRPAATKPAQTLTSVATVKQAVQVSDSTPAHLAISRSAPYTVDLGGTFNYAISFSNSGDLDATNVNVGMQIPYFTHFVSTSNGAVTVNGQSTQANPNAFTTTPRSASQVKVTGAGPDIITWDFGTLPAHSSGNITLTVQIQSGFVDDCVRDHSLYVSADNAASALLAPNPIGTWVVGKDFDVAKWEVLGCFCEHLGIPINTTTAPALQAYVTSLTRDSKVHAVGGLDFLQLSNGAMVFPIGHNQVIALVSEGGGGLTAGPGSQVVSNDGGSIIATGNANAITINGVASLGAKDCNYLLANCQSIVAGGGGNIVAGGGGNIVAGGGGNLIARNDDGTFSLLSNEVGGASSLIHAQTNGIIAAGGGNAIANGFGFIVGTGLIGQDGSGLIGQDGSGLIGQDGSGLLSEAGNGLVLASSGNVISNDGGSVISNDGGSVISNDGGSLTQGIGGPSN